MTDTSPHSNGHGDIPEALKTPAPHPVPSLAAQAAEQDAQTAQAAFDAVHDQVNAMLIEDPALLLLNLPTLFGPHLVEMVAQGVQLGLQRAAQAEREQAQQREQQAPSGKPILLAQAPLNPAMVREAGGAPGAFGGTPSA